MTAAVYFSEDPILQSEACGSSRLYSCSLLLALYSLAKLQVVMSGGSACPDSLGDRLVDAGVNLISHYGTCVLLKNDIS